jgi:Putative MetA-pathway of phenol degradation
MDLIEKIYFNMKNIKLFILILICSLFSIQAYAQLPHDAVYMPKNNTCIALMYSNSSWNQYWENTLKRENLNMGTFTMQGYMPMAAIGLSNKLNVIVGIPYVTTKTSAGNLLGQKGIQDLSAWVKYKLLEEPNGFSLHGALGGSMPMGNYVADFLPMSIGIQSKTATGRIIADYTHKSGLYLTAHASYTYRSNITVDRDAYQSYEKVFNTNQVEIPNTTDASARFGYMKNDNQIECFVERFSCMAGDNIRRNDMPFPTNNMQATAIGVYGKYQPKSIGASARVTQVVNGLNVGQSLTFSVGLLYQVSYGKKKESGQ